MLECFILGAVAGATLAALIICCLAINRGRE